MSHVRPDVRLYGLFVWDYKVAFLTRIIGPSNADGVLQWRDYYSYGVYTVWTNSHWAKISTYVAPYTIPYVGIVLIILFHWVYVTTLHKNEFWDRAS